MFSTEINDWLRKNLAKWDNPSSTIDRILVENELKNVGLLPTDPLVHFYQNYGADAYQGWYEMLPFQEIKETSEWAQEFFEISDSYIALSSYEGGGIILYDLLSGSVYDVENGKFDELERGNLKAVGKNFEEFLLWVKSKDKNV